MESIGNSNSNKLIDIDKLKRLQCRSSSREVEWGGGDVVLAQIASAEVLLNGLEQRVMVEVGIVTAAHGDAHGPERNQRCEDLVP